MDVDAATQTMIDNIPTKTGRPLEEWFAVLDAASLEKHGQAMTLLKGEHAMTHGFANLIVTMHRDRSSTATADDLVDAQYAGAKAALRPVMEQIVGAVRGFGADVEIAPKKTSVSLRRSKQFALVEAPSSKRVQLGINLGGTPPTERLRAAGGMCTHRVDVTALEQVDDELLGWLRAAYERA